MVVPRGSRVGGVVVAAGLGWAAATGHGVASAESTPKATEGSSHGTESDSTSEDTSRDLGPRVVEDDDADTDEKNVDEDGVDDDDVDDDDVDEADPDDAEQPEEPDATDDSEETDTDHTVDEPVDDEPVVPEVEVAAVAPKDDTAADRDDTTPATEVAEPAESDEQQENPAPEQPVDATLDLEDAPNDTITPAAGPAPVVPTAFVPAVETAAVTAKQQFSVAEPTLLTSVLAAFGIVSAPFGPAEPPTMWALLAWVRRQLTGAFHNQKPTAKPLQTVVAEDGTIRGTLGAVDPDGDPIHLVLQKQAQHGTVTLNVDGTYTYTPDDPEFSGVDTFEVSLRDVGLRLFSAPGVTNTVVSIRVGDPLTVDTPELGTPDEDSGVVRGQVGVTDTAPLPAGLAYTLLNRPLYGTVTFDSATGTYTYTPTALGRLRAAVNPGLVDSFAVAVSDGIRAPIEVSVDGVTVLAGDLAVSENEIGSDSLPFGVVVSADGKHAYVTNDDNGTISVVDLTTGVVGAPIKVGENPFGLALSADGKFLYVVDSADNTLSKIDTESYAVVHKVHTGSEATAVVLSKDGTKAYVTNTLDNTVSVIDTAAGVVTRTITVGDAPVGVVLSTDGRFLFAANSDSDTVTVIDTSTESVVSSIGVGSAPAAMAVSADGKLLYVANSGVSDTGGDGTVSVVDLATGQVVSVIVVGEYPTGIAVSADGSRLYVANTFSDSVSVIDTATGEVVAIPVSANPSGVVVTADGRLLVTHADLAGDGTGLNNVTVITFDGTEFALTPPATEAGDDTLFAAASTAGPVRGGDWTRHFTFTNLTPYPVTLVGYDFDERASVPMIGTVVQPGASLQIDAQRTFWSNNWGTMTFHQAATNRTYDVRVLAKAVSRKQVLRDELLCNSGECGVDDNVMSFLDNAGSTITIAANNTDEQSRMISALCNDVANCRFTSTRSEERMSERHLVGAAVANYTSGTLQKTVAISDAQSTQTSFKVSLKATLELWKVLKVELGAEWGKTWTETHTFTETISFPVKPGYAGIVYGETPVTRFYGDMEMTIGNSTVILKDIFFDSPRPTGTPRFLAVEEKLPDYQPITL